VDVENVTPTVVVGIGQAGCSILSTLRSFTEEEDIQEKFRFVGIDSNHGDLRKNVDYQAEEVTTVELQAPEQWDENHIEYDFLHSRLLPGGERTLKRSGAQRKRRIGRYYVDSHRNFESLMATLNSVIETFAGIYDNYINRDGQAMNIWVVNSLSGGTGSGSFPMITGMIREITHKSDWDAGKFYLCGLGVLPHTGEIKDNLNYHLNAYAALKDIRNLVGADENAKKEFRLGEERSVAEHGNRIELDDWTFDRYFLQPFDQQEMSSDAYVYQLNKASACVPLYFSLIEGQEDWPDNHQETINERLYAFDTFELSVPVEDIERYFASTDRIDTLESELDRLRIKKELVMDDLSYIDAVTEVDIETYIESYCADTGEDETQAKLTEIVPEEVDIPEKVSYEMVETARSVVGGLSLDINSVEDAINDRYRSDWDDTETDDIDHREVFKYIIFQMVQRKVKEEKRDHRIHDIIESTWESHQDELIDEYNFLESKDAPRRWRDGIRKFLDTKIAEAERNLPTGALYAGGISASVMILLMVSLLQNLGAIGVLTRRSIELGSVVLSWAWTLIGLIALISTILVGFYAVQYIRKSSLESQRQECREAYSEFQRLDNLSEIMTDRLDRLNLGQDALENRNSTLASKISDRETSLENQRSLLQTVKDRLNTKKDVAVEHDRKLALRIHNTKKLETPGIKSKIHEYINSHQSIDLKVTGQDPRDEGVDVTARTDLETEGNFSDNQPDSIGWFESRDIIKQQDISNAMNEILDERLKRCVLRDYQNKDPKRDRILQYVWNPANEIIKDATGGNYSYKSLISEYDDNQHNGVIGDEFRVMMMGVYTNFYLKNSSVYYDIDTLYASGGDKEVIETFEGGDNFVTQRFAYPEFYDTTDHPLSEYIGSYPR
jgi:hypothetical protein